MTRVIIGPLLVPRSPEAKGMSLRMFALICSFIISIILSGLLFLFIAGCARVQPPCAGCYIGLQQVELSR